MIIHNRNPGRDDEPKGPIQFEQPEKTVRLPGDSVMGEIAYVRDHHLLVHGMMPTRLTLGHDKVGTVLSELQLAEPELTLDDLPDSMIAGMSVTFDFTINGIKVE